MTAPRLLIATRNPGKVREYAQLLRDLPFELVSLDDAGVDQEVEETGETFHDNAALKAGTYASLSGILALADDSGLEVDALGGDPGVRSARYGEQPPSIPPSQGGSYDGSQVQASLPMSDQDRVNLLLQNLENVPWERRTARFKCVICIARPANEGGFDTISQVVGSVSGMIQYQPQGDDGFGYDPVFYLPSYGKTLAQIPLEEKNRISHRADAAGRARAALQELSESS